MLLLQESDFLHYFFIGIHHLRHEYSFTSFKNIYIPHILRVLAVRQGGFGLSCLSARCYNVANIISF